ncbi:MAG: AAA family ATPase, partial [Phormidesmis sp. CAN_BIN44]|nr:AAA family ATPase [Phormidesmis sp. CAN_BIN44]
MGVDEVLEFADELVFGAIGGHFDDLTQDIFRGSWNGQIYEQIAQDLDYDESYVRSVGACLFGLLSRVLGESVSKTNFRSALERRYRAHRLVAPSTAIAANTDFLGRERAIADLNQLVSQGAKIIVIQGEGGLGKTTIARKYLDAQGFDLQLELWMPTEPERITPAESVVEEW